MELVRGLELIRDRRILRIGAGTLVLLPALQKAAQHGELESSARTPQGLRRARVWRAAKAVHFASTDPRTQTCVYSGGALGFGLFLVVLAVLLESVTFFVTQYSALEILHARERHSLAISKVDFVTRAVGKRLTVGVLARGGVGQGLGNDCRGRGRGRGGHHACRQGRMSPSLGRGEGRRGEERGWSVECGFDF